MAYSSLLRLSRDVSCLGKRSYCGLSSAQLVMQRVSGSKNGNLLILLWFYSVTDTQPSCRKDLEVESLGTKAAVYGMQLVRKLFRWELLIKKNTLLCTTDWRESVCTVESNLGPYSCNIRLNGNMTHNKECHNHTSLYGTAYCFGLRNIQSQCWNSVFFSSRFTGSLSTEYGELI